MVQYHSKNIETNRNLMGVKKMSPKQADKIIKAGKPTTVHDTFRNETFTKTFISRDRWDIFSSDGGVFDRGELDVIEFATFKEQSA